MFKTVPEYAMKHSTTRWFTLRKIVVQLVEQHENLKEYFLNFLPETTGFSRCKRNSNI